MSGWQSELRHQSAGLVHNRGCRLPELSLCESRRADRNAGYGSCLRTTDVLSGRGAWLSVLSEF